MLCLLRLAGWHAGGQQDCAQDEPGRLCAPAECHAGVHLLNAMLVLCTVLMLASGLGWVGG
jgi:hypothetical protein